MRHLGVPSIYSPVYSHPYGPETIVPYAPFGCASCPPSGSQYGRFGPLGDPLPLSTAPPSGTLNLRLGPSSRSSRSWRQNLPALAGLVSIVPTPVLGLMLLAVPIAFSILFGRKYGLPGYVIGFFTPSVGYAVIRAMNSAGRKIA